MATIALTIGAPAKTMDMTTPGRAFGAESQQHAKRARRADNPASSDHPIPAGGKLQAALRVASMASGASTAVRK